MFNKRTTICKEVSWGTHAQNTRVTEPLPHSFQRRALSLVLVVFPCFHVMLVRIKMLLHFHLSIIHLERFSSSVHTRRGPFRLLFPVAGIIVCGFYDCRVPRVTASVLMSSWRLRLFTFRSGLCQLTSGGGHEVKVCWENNIRVHLSCKSSNEFNVASDLKKKTRCIVTNHISIEVLRGDCPVRRSANWRPSDHINAEGVGENKQNQFGFTDIIWFRLHVSEIIPPHSAYPIRKLTWERGRLLMRWHSAINWMCLMF